MTAARIIGGRRPRARVDRRRQGLLSQLWRHFDFHDLPVTVRAGPSEEAMGRAILVGRLQLLGSSFGF